MHNELTYCTATEYWTETNIANGLNALATCIEVCDIDRLIAQILTKHVDGVLLRLYDLGVQCAGLQD